MHIFRVWGDSIADNAMIGEETPVIRKNVWTGDSVVVAIDVIANFATTYAQTTVFFGNQRIWQRQSRQTAEGFAMGRDALCDGLRAVQRVSEWFLLVGEEEVHGYELIDSSTVPAIVYPKLQRRVSRVLTFQTDSSRQQWACRSRVDGTVAWFRRCVQVMPGANDGEVEVRAE